MAPTGVVLGTQSAGSMMDPASFTPLPRTISETWKMAKTRFGSTDLTSKQSVRRRWRGVMRPHVSSGRVLVLWRPKSVGVQLGISAGAQGGGATQPGGQSETRGWQGAVLAEPLPGWQTASSQGARYPSQGGHGAHHGTPPYDLIHLLPKASSPNTFTLGVRGSTQELWGDTTPGATFHPCLPIHVLPCETHSL